MPRGPWWPRRRSRDRCRLREEPRSSSSMRSAEQPGLLELPLRFERADLVAVAQREADFIPPVDQALLAECVDLERPLLAVRLDDALPRHVDRQLVAGKRGDFGEQPV